MLMSAVDLPMLWIDQREWQPHDKESRLWLLEFSLQISVMIAVSRTYQEVMFQSADHLISGQLLQKTEIPSPIQDLRHRAAVGRAQ
jgi:hypothetical protein